MIENKYKRVLINCSNLHAGGGVAVAVSFVSAMNRFVSRDIRYSLLASSEVMSGLRSKQADLEFFENVSIKDFYGLGAIWGRLDKHFDGFDLVFSVFGPVYFLRPVTKHLTGFAQPNIIYPNNPIIKKAGFLEKISTKIKYSLQELFFSRSDALVVELEHVRERLLSKTLFSKKQIEIVYSAIDSIYSKSDLWRALDIEATFDQRQLKLGVISRNYPHKNLITLPAVKRILKDKYGIECDFYVTFDEREWGQCSDSFQRNVINVGGLLLTQCPTFYSRMDGVIFPSFLECFSAVPLESMAMKRPLFASDLPFIRDVCGGVANYFNPNDVDNIAEVIFRYYQKDKHEQRFFTQKARQHILKFGDADRRASEYMALISKLVN